MHTCIYILHTFMKKTFDTIMKIGKSLCTNVFNRKHKEPTKHRAVVAIMEPAKYQVLMESILATNQ